MKSKCCQEELKVVGGEEGTMFYQCLGCGKGADPMPHQKQSSWEDTLEKLFEPTGRWYIAHGRDYRAIGSGGKTWEDQHKIIKSFISSTIQEAWEEEREKIKQNIGFLRQWLNEKPESLLVTNEHIELWLFDEKLASLEKEGGDHV